MAMLGLQGKEPAPDIALAYRKGGIANHAEAVKEARFFKSNFVADANVFDIYERNGDGPTYRIDLREEGYS